MDSYIRKIILVGDGAVGKTSLVRRFVVNMYSDGYIQTIGAKVSKKEVALGDGNMTLMIWDIIGQQGFRRTQITSMQNTKGALLVADLTRKGTLASLLNYWIPMIIKMAGPVPLVFLGNKSDLGGESQFDISDLKNVASTCEYFGTDLPCYLTSAKTGENVEAAFIGLAARVRDYTGQADLCYDSVALNLEAADPMIDILDRIFVDFADQFGGIEHSTPFIKQQMKLSGLDINKPTGESIRRFIENLAAIEVGQKPMNEVLSNKKNRYELFRSRFPKVLLNPTG